MDKKYNNQKDIFYSHRGVNPPKETKLIMPCNETIKTTTAHDGRIVIAKNQCGIKAANSPFRVGIRKKEYLKPEEYIEKGPQLVKKKVK